MRKLNNLILQHDIKKQFLTYENLLMMKDNCHKKKLYMREIRCETFKLTNSENFQ